MTNSGEILSSKSGHLGLGSLGFLRRGWKNGLRDDLGNLYRARETQIPPNSGSAAFLESPGRQRRGEEEGKRGGGTTLTSGPGLAAAQRRGTRTAAAAERRGRAAGWADPGVGRSGKEGREGCAGGPRCMGEQAARWGWSGPSGRK
jgi:hypothetical protein